MSEQQATTKPTIFIDASSLKDSSCLRRLVYNNFYGFRGRESKTEYILGYGSAFHKALEYWYSCDRSVPENKGIAIQKALDYYKPFTPFISQKPYEFRTPDHLSKSITQYFNIYNQDAESLKPIKGLITPGLLETKWTYPAELLDSRLSSEYFNLVIAGTIDMIASYFGEEIFVDHKTTATKWGDKDKFFLDYDLDIQMMLYSLMLKKLTGNNFRFMINGVFLKGVTKAAEKEGEFDGVNFERYGPRSYSEMRLSQFEFMWLVPKLLQFKDWLQTYYHSWSLMENMTPDMLVNPNFSACHPKFGCPYISICSKDPQDQAGILKLMTRESYNPLKFGA